MIAKVGNGFDVSTGIQMKFWSDYCATAGEHVDSKDNPWVAQTEPVDRVVSTADDDKVRSSACRRGYHRSFY